MDFADLDETSSQGVVSRAYSLSSVTFDIEPGTSEARINIRATHAAIDGFSAANSADGSSQTGVSEVSFGFSRKILNKNKQVLNWSVDFSSPGSTNLSPFMFTSITHGQTFLKLGLDYSLNYRYGSLGIGVSYAYRPGALTFIDQNGPQGRTELRLDVPDVLGIDLSLPFYYKKAYFGALINYEQALGGIDIGSPTFGEAVDLGFYPFPATEEMRLFGGLIVGMMVNKTSFVDLTINRQLMGKNTDRGLGVNLGYSTSF